MINIKSVLLAVMLFSSFSSVSFIQNFFTANAIPPYSIGEKFVFGPITGFSQSENGTIEWILAGNWRSTLTNDTTSTTTAQNNTTAGISPFNETAGVSAFNAAIEMIRPDGTGRHTHTLTEFNVDSVSNPDTNSTSYNGTSTISLREGPALDIPTSIQKFNEQVFVMYIDPESVDHHFGEEPTIFGIAANPELMKQAPKTNVSSGNDVSAH